MINKILLLITFSTVFKIFYLTAITCDEKYYNYDTNLANLVYKRFYLIKRLERTLDYMIEIKKNVKQENFDKEKIFDLNISDYKNDYIKSCVKTIKINKNCKPLMMLWKDFLAYKFIEDKIFDQDFIKLIFNFTKNLMAQNKLIPNFNSYCFNNYIEDLDIIDNNLISLKKNIILDANNFKAINSSDEINTEEILTRFYYLKRLEKIFWLLNYFKNTNFPDNFFNTEKKFNNLKLNLCLENLQKNKNISHLIEIISDVKHFKYIQDKNFIEEFSKLIFIVSQNISQSKKIKNLNLDEKDIENILNAIDIIAEELPELLEKYELDSELKWKQWFNKYWWAPPIIVGILSFKIIQKIKAENIYKIYTKIKNYWNDEPEKKPVKK